MGKYQPLEMLADTSGPGVSVPTTGKAMDITGYRGTVHAFLDDGATAAVVNFKFGNALTTSGGTDSLVIVYQATLPVTAKNNSRGDGVSLEQFEHYRWCSVDVVSVSGGKVRAVMNRSED